jgi:phage FluMu protein Com
MKSAKHLKELNGTNFKQTLSNNFECEKCNRLYATASGLWKHHQKCIVGREINTIVGDTNEPTDKELMMMILKDNSELKTIIMEVVKNGTMQNSHNTTNSHNKAFNLNFFLNETCKDAMNITDFVESIQLQLSDLERVGELGYVEGISNIIVKNLKDLDVTQRPVHCTDKKRETMYVKDEDKWEKDEENSKIKKVIKKVASKNQRLLPKFKEVHPDCMTYHSKYSDQYNKLIVESMGGSGDNDTEKEEKIIRNISKIVSVDK